jgi:cyclopropane fatty-acyl-phospholipid synthase-like methyltransferase
MHAMSRHRAAMLVDHLDLAGVRRIIDVGGGSGDNAYEVLRRLPDAAAVVFDLPEVVPITAECAALAGMSDRIELRPGDYRQDEVGEGFDLAIVSQVLHGASPEGCLVILEKSLRALRPGGRVVVHEFVLTDDGAEPSWASLFSLNMLTGGAPGRSYTRSELREMLLCAGFVDVEYVPLPGDTDLLIARRAGAP